MKTTKRLPILTMLIFAAVCSSCFWANPTGGNPTSLTITIIDQIGAKSLTPPLDLVPSLYSITGTGPGTAGFTASTAGSPISELGLASGAWSLSVQATNSGGILIGRGQVNVIVNDWKTVPVTLTVTAI